MRPQMRIQTIAQATRHEWLGDVAMRDLRQRVHAGIGAAGAVDADMLAADRLDRGFQCTLHRRAIVLYLPAAKWPAVIFDDEFVPRHHSMIPKSGYRFSDKIMLMRAAPAA